MHQELVHFNAPMPSGGGRAMTERPSVGVPSDSLFSQFVQVLRLKDLSTK